MKMPEKLNDKLGIVLLLIICVSLLAVVVFLLAPYLWDTISLMREYESAPDTWTYYVVLVGCVLAFLASLFLIFNHYFYCDNDGGEQGAE
jgi:TRAP-type C4-dicarboxylate transport system permease small subunit